MKVIAKPTGSQSATRTQVSPHFNLSSRETSELIRNISRMVKRETNLGVQEMDVFIEEGKIVLSGYCKTFYTKQLAQQAAMKLIGVVELINRIRVI